MLLKTNVFLFLDSSEIIVKSLRDNNCFNSDYSKRNIIPNSSCQDRFIWSNQFYLKHVSTGLCLRPDSWYGRYNPGARLAFTGDCSSHHSAFFPTSQGTIVHPISGYCLYNNGYSIVISHCGTSSSHRFSIITGIVIIIHITDTHFYNMTSFFMACALTKKIHIPPAFAGVIKMRTSNEEKSEAKNFEG